VAEAVADGQTECTILLPRRGFHSAWQRLLHDRTADKIAAVASQVPHVSATIVPFNLGHLAKRYQDAAAFAVAALNAPGATSDSDGTLDSPSRRERARAEPASAADQALALRSAGTEPIGNAQWRKRVRVAGRVKSVRVQPRAGTSNLECVLTDASGGILLVFQGRPRIPGILPGARLVAEGMVGSWGRRLAMLNPDYELVSGPDGADDPIG
jgi:hypothetical protein